MALATRAPAGAAPPPGMALIAALHEKNKSAADRIGGHIKDVCVQFRMGGADIPAIITSIPKKKDGAWSQSFTALVLNVRGILGDKDQFATTESFRWHARSVAQQEFFDPKALTMADIPKDTDTPEAKAKASEVEAAVAKRRAEIEVRAAQEYGCIAQAQCIVLPVSPPGERSESKPTEDQLAAMPETTLMRSFTTYWFSAKEGLLSNVKPGDVVTLKSVYCNGAKPMENHLDNDWGMFLNVGAFEPARGLTLSEVYSHTNALDQTYFLPVDPESFDLMRENETRYGTTPVVLHVRKDVGIESQSRNSAITRPIWPEPGAEDIKEWTYTPKNETGLKPCANLKVRVMQWAGTYRENCEQGVLVGTTLYDDQIAQLGITDAAKWFSIAPHLFRVLKYTCVGVLDRKLTQEKYAGASVDGDISFPIHIKTNLFVADMRRAYTKIGIPVTATFVRKQFNMADNAELSAHEGFAVKMAPSVISLECTDNAGLIRPLTAYADKHPGQIDFRAILGCRVTEVVKEGIATMLPETGSALLTAMIEKDKDAKGNTQVADLKKSMNLFTHMIIVAIRAVDYGAKTNSEREIKLAKFLGAGQPVPAQLAIKDASASASAEASAPAAVASGEVAGTDDVLLGDATVEELDGDADEAEAVTQAGAEPEPVTATAEASVDADAPRAKGKGKRTASTTGAKPKKGKAKRKRQRVEEE